MKSLLFTLLVAMPATIFAQSNYHEGYVVKNNGYTTVKGYIDYREWDQSPLSIDFRTNKDDKQTVQFNPTNIKSFHINGFETYITYSGLISNDRNRLPDLPNFLDTSKVQTDIFLRLVTSGQNLSLYSQADSRKTRYFVAEGSAQPIELKYNQYYDDNHDAIERSFFRGQLIYYINKYAAADARLISHAEHVAFETDPLEQIINEINGNSPLNTAGYILKNNGDTLRGFINYHEREQTPKSVELRANKEDKQTLAFDPGNIKSFEINGLEKYIAYNGLISNDRNRLPDLPNFLDTSKIHATIFLKQIASGKYLSLFSQTDSRKTRYFVVEGNSNPVELKFHQYFTDNHEVVDLSYFRGQLIYYISKYASGNAKLIDQAQGAAFENDQLMQITEEINGNPDFIAKNEQKQSKFRWYIGAGLLYTKTEYNNPNFAVATETGMFYYKFQSHAISVLPQINTGIDIFGNPNVQQLIFRTNVSISAVSVSIAYPISATQNDNLSFDQFTLGFTPQMIYNVYNKDKLKIYIDGGVAVNFSSYSSDTPLNLSSFWVGIPFQTGVVINKKIEFSFTFTPYTSIVQTTSEKLSNQSFSLGLRFFLSNK